MHSNSDFVLSFYFSVLSFYVSCFPLAWEFFLFDSVLCRQAWEHAVLRWQISSGCCNDFLVLLKSTSIIQRRQSFFLFIHFIICQSKFHRGSQLVGILDPLRQPDPESLLPSPAQIICQLDLHLASSVCCFHFSNRKEPQDLVNVDWAADFKVPCYVPLHKPCLLSGRECSGVEESGLP